MIQPLRMSRPFRSLVLGLVLVAPVLVPAIAGAGGSAVCAAGRPHVALVVDTGARTTTYCVALDSSTASGLHVIQLAAAQYGMDYRLGFGAQAVCRLDHVGTDGGDCFGSYPDYWGYWHGNGSGGWTWAGSGAGSATVRDGAVEGWSWGAGDSGTTHPPPPRLRLADVCAAPSPTPTPPPTPSATPSPHASSAPPPSQAAAPSSHAPGGAHVTASSSPPASQALTPTPRAPSPDVHASATPIIERAVATSGTTPSAGGPPTGAILAAFAVLALLGGGWFTSRRRHVGSRP